MDGRRRTTWSRLCAQRRFSARKAARSALCAFAVVKTYRSVLRSGQVRPVTIRRNAACGPCALRGPCGSHYPHHPSISSTTSAFSSPSCSRSTAWNASRPSASRCRPSQYRSIRTSGARSFRRSARLWTLKETASVGLPVSVSSTPIWLKELAMPARSPSASLMARDLRYQSRAAS
jgi:hypothetical protein